MSTNIDISPFEPIRKLQFSPFRFEITGSRYFGWSTPDSDWDFYSLALPSCADWLKDKDFKRISMNPDWYDQNTASIWRHNSNVEVSLQHNYKLKTKAQFYILDHKELLITLRECDRTKRVEVWNEAFIRCIT